MTIQAIPSYNTLKALKTSKKYNTPENIASQNSNKQITQLPHYNSSVFFHPSFMGLIKSSTTEALKNQSKSNLYHLFKLLNCSSPINK